MIDETREEYRNRKRMMLHRIDKATKGEFCGKLPEIVKAQAAFLQNLISDLVPKNLSAIRTEYERLADYIEYVDYCSEKEEA